MNRPFSHSGLGITGIVLGSLAVFILLLNITLFMVFRANNHLTSSNQLVLTVLAVFNIIIVIVGLTSSLKGILQQERKKTLAVIGLVLNLFVLILYISGIIVLVL
ncbi:MAG: hypothetical protein V1709_09970 [Planctomycetota bacterium]